MNIKKPIGIALAASSYLMFLRLLALSRWDTILLMIGAGVFVGAFSALLAWLLKDDGKEK